MSVIVIQKKVICDSTERQIILEPQQQDILFEEDLIILYRFHHEANNGGLEITTPFVEQLPEDTAEWAAIKEYYNSWAIPHILLYLFVYGIEVDDTAPRQTLALPNYGVPFPLPLNQPIRLKAGQGLAIELVDNGYGMPDSNRPDTFITIYGDAWLGRNEFTAQTVNVDAKSQVINEGGTSSPTPTPIDISQFRRVTLSDISSIEIKFRMPSGSTGVALYEVSSTMNNSLLFDDDEVGLWQPIANNVRGNNPNLDIFTTLRSCGHVIEVEFNQTLTIGQISMVTPDFPDRAMGTISVTEDYRNWRQVYTGTLSGDIPFSNAERARKIEIVAPLKDNLVDGSWKIYEINIWVAEEALEINNDPLIIQQATFRLNPEEVNISTLESYESFTLAEGSTAPLVKTEDNRKYVEWRFTGNNDEKKLVSSEQFVVKSLLIELRSPTTSWGVNGSPDNANGGMIAGLSPQNSSLFTALGGTSSIWGYPAYEKVSRNNIMLTEDNTGGVDLVPINNWFWLYIELKESFANQLALGLGSYSWHRLDVDVRQILTYNAPLTEGNVSEIISHFREEEIKFPPLTVPVAWNNANIRLDLIEPVGTVSSTSGFNLSASSRAVPPEIKEGNGKKYISWRYQSNFQLKALYGHLNKSLKSFLIEIKSPLELWGYNGQFQQSSDGFVGGSGFPPFSPLTVQGGQATLSSYPHVGRLMRNGIELAPPYNLSPIDEWFWLFVEFSEVVTPNDWMIGFANTASRTDFDLRHFFAWENTPTNAEIDDLISYCDSI